MGKFYLTTPIYYVNSRPHLGHAYTTMIADLVAGYRRQRGDEVFFLTGTDEHGQNIERAAAQAGLAVQQHVDQIVAEYKEIFAQMGFTHNHWIRTTDNYHKQGAQELFRRVRDNGYIYLGHYEGWYCVGCAEFKEETTPGEPPHCELHDRQAERLSEESYFFKLSEFQERLLRHYEEHPDFIRPEVRRNEVVSFVKSGLKDLSVSRVSVKWGIPVPDDPKHTMYVWFDALSNYITALGFGNSRAELLDYWPADLHLVGKDILRFHTVYWPAFLMAAGLELPKTVFAHGMWLSGGRKMSKTLGNVIDLKTLLHHFSNDQIRYFCFREMAFGQDGDFTYEALIDRVNGDLAKGLGNLYSRTLKMVEKYCESKLPAKPVSQNDAVVQAVLAQKMRFEEEFASYNFSRALEAVWEAISVVDKYISDSAPWKLAKDEANREQLETVLYIALETLRHLTLQLAPVMPVAAQAMWAGMGLEGNPLEIDPNSTPWGSLPSGRTIREVTPLFPTLDKEKIMSEISEQAVKPVEVSDKPTISIDDFAKVDLRVALVLEAERVPKADKLLRLVVDLGEQKPRQILAGIAQYYTPEQMVGRKIVVVANLEPRKLRGLESQGMLLAASLGEQGQPVLAGFHEDVPVGARLK